MAELVAVGVEDQVGQVHRIPPESNSKQRRELRRRRAKMYASRKGAARGSGRPAGRGNRPASWLIFCQSFHLKMGDIQSPATSVARRSRSPVWPVNAPPGMRMKRHHPSTVPGDFRLLGCLPGQIWLQSLHANRTEIAMLMPILSVKAPIAAAQGTSAVEAAPSRERAPIVAIPGRISGTQSEAVLKILETLNLHLLGTEPLPKDALIRLLDTLAKILKFPPLPQETLRDFTKRLGRLFGNAASGNAGGAGKAAGAAQSGDLHQDPRRSAEDALAQRYAAPARQAGGNARDSPRRQHAAGWQTIAGCDRAAGPGAGTRAGPSGTGEHPANDCAESGSYC